MTDIRYRSLTEIRYGDRVETRRAPPPTRHPWGRWAVQALGAVLLLIGLILAVGGAWLAALGGSWYYLLAGLGLVASGAGSWAANQAASAGRASSGTAVAAWAMIPLSLAPSR